MQRRPISWRHGALVAICSMLLAMHAAAEEEAPAANENTSTPGKLSVDPPTLICLGVKWLIQGDKNRNATVSLEYRKVGEEEWKTGYPLLRAMDGDAPKKIKVRHIGNCLKADPAYGKGVADALGIALSDVPD